MAKGQKAQDPVIVDLYRATYNADHPLTFAELVDAMPSAYQNDANRGYAKHRDEAGDDPIPDPWSRRQLRTALEWWVGTQVSACVRDKRLIAKAADGRSSHRSLHRDQLVYTANPHHPPTVLVEVWEMKPTKWTSEIGATGRRHVAGIKFNDALARIQPLGSKVPIKDREQRIAALEAALELAAEALSVPPRVKD